MPLVVVLVLLSAGDESTPLENDCSRELVYFVPLATWAKAAPKPTELIARIDRVVAELSDIQAAIEKRRFEGLSERLGAVKAIHRQLVHELRCEMGGLLVDGRNELPAGCSVTKAALSFDGRRIKSGSGRDLSWLWERVDAEFPIPGDHTIGVSLVVQCEDRAPHEESAEQSFRVGTDVVNIVVFMARPALTFEVKTLRRTDCGNAR